MLTGARPVCKAGLCCGAAVEKNKAESVIIESCQSEGITLYTIAGKKEPGATKEPSPTFMSF